MVTPYDVRHLDLATTDAELRAGLLHDRNLRLHDFDLPSWLTDPRDRKNVRGLPKNITQARLTELHRGALPANPDERRWLRNRVTIDHVIDHVQPHDLRYLELARTDAELRERLRLDPSLGAHTWTLPIWLSKSNQSANTTPAGPVAQAHQNHPLEIVNECQLSRNRGAIHEIVRAINKAQTKMHPRQPAEDVIARASTGSQQNVDAQATVGSNARTQPNRMPPKDVDRIDPDPTSAFGREVQRSPSVELLEHTYRAVTSFSHQRHTNPVPSDAAGCQVVFAVSRDLVQTGNGEVESNTTTDRLQRKQSPISKRKASPKLSEDAQSRNADLTLRLQPLAELADIIRKALGEAASNETIQLCGLAPLHIMVTHPRDVLQLAYDKLHSWAFKDVPPCWRRLYEDASLHITAKLLEELLVRPLPEKDAAKCVSVGDPTCDLESGIAEAIKTVDGAIVIAGAPGRKILIDNVLHRLEIAVKSLLPHPAPQQLAVDPPVDLQTEHSVQRASRIFEHDAFQLHLDEVRGPVILRDTFNHWPAMQLWHDVAYLKAKTIGGYRIVPVEIGSSYVAEGWRQKMMTFSEFVEKFLVPDEPGEIGYLAQHDLFAQVPSLRDDIRIPDYCHTTPPSPTGAAADTPGLAGAISSEEPFLNAWLGPKGTKSPLHTDPYHNILCQVVGYKYVRLYAPEESAKLYPIADGETGVPMNNTSQVDIAPFRPGKRMVLRDLHQARDTRAKFPLFANAKYQEAILGPGECLYIPLGWWHYVESLTVSFSVSFWWA